jgi:guanidinopropionase
MCARASPRRPHEHVAAAGHRHEILALEELMERKRFQPVDAASVPRFAGMPTFMRLPMAMPGEVDIALVGVPFDGGTTNRPGARHGPREIRNQSSLIRRIHHVTGVSPYDIARVADCGDSPINPIGLADTLKKIEGFFAEIRSAGAVPVTAGGDHLISLPVLRALAGGGPVGMIHFDAHSDTNDRYFGDNPYTHGTPFRRAVEEGLLDPRRIVQIGIRGAIYDAGDYDFARANGIRIIFIEELAERGPAAVMEEARSILGDLPSYVSFDIDVIDPSMAPGTGTPEIGGITTREALQMLRLLRGLPIIGADVVEVSPPFDPSGATALAGATVMFELVCVIAEQRAAAHQTEPDSTAA